MTAGLFFAALFAAPALAYRFLGLNAIFAFWFAYILTRPLGASFADWMGKSRTAGGLGWGDGAVAGCLAVMIVLLVAYLTVTGKDQPAQRTSPRRGEPGQLRSSAEQA
jgi:uncharacterized membrane-anchored protein